jgi:hypothetical protein
MTAQNIASQKESWQKRRDEIGRQHAAEIVRLTWLEEVTAAIRAAIAPLAAKAPPHESVVFRLDIPRLGPIAIRLDADGVKEYSALDDDIPF